MNALDDALQRLCFEIKDRVERLDNSINCVGVGVSLQPSDYISNMWHAPKHGVVNPERKPSWPLHYKGWQGMLHLRTEKRLPYGLSKHLTDECIHVSGGGSSIRSNPWDKIQNAVYHTSYRKSMFGRISRDEVEVYSYNVKLFQADFPKHWKEFERAVLMDALASGERKIHYDYVYTSHEVRAQDLDALQKYARLKTFTRI